MSQLVRHRVHPHPAPGEPLALMIGMTPEELPARGGALGRARFETMPYILLHAALARAPWADYVVSPLVGDHFDALDLASELDRAGFGGQYLVVLPALPRPCVIRRELSQIAPRLRVDLVSRCYH